MSQLTFWQKVSLLLFVGGIGVAAVLSIVFYYQLAAAELRYLFDAALFLAA